MPQVRVAAAALYLGSGHAVAGVRFGLDGGLIRGRVEARPPGAGVVFGIGLKQRLPAAYALVHARRLGIRIFSRKGRFRALLPGHIILIRRELLLPSGFIFADFLVHGYSLPPSILVFVLSPLGIGYTVRDRRFIWPHAFRNIHHTIAQKSRC